MPERRNPASQQPSVNGRRKMDPSMTSREVADRLGVSTNFVLGEVRDGRLLACTYDRPGRRVVYRFSEQQLEAYQVRYAWPQRVAADAPGALDARRVPDA